jgi:hypothetical protein
LGYGPGSSGRSSAGWWIEQRGAECSSRLDGDPADRQRKPAHRYRVTNQARPDYDPNYSWTNYSGINFPQRHSEYKRTGVRLT